MTPRFERVRGQHPLDRLRRNLVDHAVMHPLSGQFGTLPLRQGTPNDIGTLTRNFHDIQGNGWGKKRVGDSGRFLSESPSMSCVAKRSALLRTCRSHHSTCLAVAAKEEPSANSNIARARLASPTGVFCFQSYPIKVARVWSFISIWIAEWRPCISLPQSMSCRRHETSVTTLPIFPSLFNGDLY